MQSSDFWTLKRNEVVNQLRIVPLVLICILVRALPFSAQDSTSDPKGWPHNDVTPTWEEGVALFSALAELDSRASWMEIGKADCGQPIHALFISPTPVTMPGLPGVLAAKESHPEHLRMLVNNAIHPGEPCGVDASLAFVRQLLGQPYLPDGIADNACEHDPQGLEQWPEGYNRSWAGMPSDWGNAMFVIIPFYNVGGVLNRGCCSRANQNGPLAYGFRGNSRNFDLNRDFLKMDTQNAKAFARLFTEFDPDVFVDTHTTNGADYPYTMTCITSQYDKAGPVIGDFLERTWDPPFYGRMAGIGYPMSPYVYSREQIPDSGLIGFLETPRYSTGYAMLWGTMGFTAEAHMLKPYPERVQSMLNFLHQTLNTALDLQPEVKMARRLDQERLLNADSLPVRWSRDDTSFDLILFNGYAARETKSAVTGRNRLVYKRDMPWSSIIPFYNAYEVSEWAHIPSHYVIPNGWESIIDKLRSNGVAMSQVDSTYSAELEVTYIVDFHSSSAPYEGHHLNTVDSLEKRVEVIDLSPGDWLIPTNQRARRYLVESLEIMAHDAFWVWGGFDSALQRKEGFSAYVFEDTAETLLANDALLSAEFELAKSQHPIWEDQPQLALQWIYEHSPFAEPSGGRYPVMKAFN